MNRVGKADDWAERLVAWLGRHRAAVILVWLAVALVLGAGAFRLGFEQDSRVYFSADNPERAALATLEARHGRLAAAILMLEPDGGSVFSVPVLTAIADATARARAISGVAAVRSLTALEAPQFSEFGLPAALIEDGGSVTPARVDLARSFWQDEREDLVPLVSAAGDIAAVVMLFPTNAGAHVDGAVAAKNLKAALAGDYPAFRWRLSGDAVMDLAFLDAIVQDIFWLGPLQGVFLVALVLAMLQSLWAAVALFAVLAVTVAVTLGAAGWVGLDLNGVTSATPMILLGLAVAACIHILMAWQQALRAGGTRAHALTATIRLNAFPVFLAIFSTVASFLCLNFSDSPPFAQLGNLIAFGLSVTFLLAFTLLPVLVMVLPAGAAPRRARFEELMAGLGRRVVRARGGLMVLLALIVVGSLSGVTKLTFDDRFAHYFSERLEFRRDTDFMEKRLTGLTRLEFSLPAGGPGRAATADHLRAVARFEAWLRAGGEVEAVSGLAGTLRKVAAQMPVATGPDGLPQTDADARTVLETWQSFSGGGAGGRKTVSDDGTHSLLTVTLSQVSSRQIRDFAARAEGWLAANAPEIAAPATGMPLLAAYLSARNTTGMAVGTAVALVMVSLVLLVALRSVRLGLISLVPNLVPMLAAYGLWGAVSGEVTFAATVVMAMTFGIVVDDTVHLLAKYDRLRREQRLDAVAAIPQGFRTVGMAVLATTLAIASGFAVLGLSDFLVNRDLGLLTLAVLFSALFAVLFLLPPLLVYFDRRRT